MGIFEIFVGKENCNYTTISEAVQAVPYGTPAIIYVGTGIYREKLFCEKKDITFVGSGVDETILEYGDAAFDIMQDGSKRGTFRSYTAFFGGERVTVRNMTIRNTAGDGSRVGQAISVYADASYCCFENVRIEGHQDTLFMAPLPVSERQKNGFMGPRFLTPRLKTSQYYKDCVITGDVDFIFGGADAVFDNCEIVCNNRQASEEKSGERVINGYVTAPCGSKDSLGMVFRNCRVHGEDGTDDSSVFLGRPWRDEARAVFLDCVMNSSIACERFSGWGKVDKVHEDTYFGEYGTVDAQGNAINVSGHAAWIRNIDKATYDKINKEAENLIVNFAMEKN